MEKFINLTMALVIVFCLASCGGNGKVSQGIEMEIILYNDDTGEVLDANEKRICGFELSGGRKGIIHIRTSQDIDFFGATTKHIYLQKGYAYAEFSDALRDKTENGVPFQKEDKGSEIHYYLIPSGKIIKETTSSTSEKASMSRETGKSKNWLYNTKKDPMTDEVVHFAYCDSQEKGTVCGSRTKLHLGLANKDSKNFATLFIDGGILRQDMLPMAHIRFDNGEIKMWSVMADGATIHNLVDADEFVSQLKSSKKCAIKIECEDGGTATYTFNTEGLEWEF